LPKRTCSHRATPRGVRASAYAVLAAAYLATAAGALASDPCPPAPVAAQPPARELAYGAGLLWRVQRPGVAPSHVFGTVHLSDPQVLTLPAPVHRAFQRSRALLVEVILDPAAQAAYSTAAFAGAGPGLDRRLHEAIYGRFTAIVAGYGIDPATARGLRPWAALNLIARPPPGDDVILDELLVRRARAAGMAVQALETMHELVAALEALAESDQIALLTAAICDHEALRAEIPVLRAHYLAGDLAGLWRIATAPAADAGVQQRFLEQLLYARNERMVERLRPHLSTGSVFVAVGALHLPGERGLLAALAARGWRLRRVH